MHGTAVGGDILWVLMAAAVITGIAAPVAMRMYYRERQGIPNRFAPSNLR